MIKLLMAVLGVALIVSGCGTARDELRGGGPVQGTARRELSELWADRPEYVALVKHMGPFFFGERPNRNRAPELPKAVLKNKEPFDALVMVSVVIDETGKVEAARVIESNDTRFEAASLKAARQWTLPPWVMNDMAVKSFAEVPVRFYRRRSD